MARMRSFGLQISYLARLARSRFDQRASAVGLTRAQWQAIAAISLREGATQTEIAADLDVSTVTVGRLVERLEQHNWIERQPDAADRRAYRLYLRPSVVPILEQLGAIARDEERTALAGLSAEECATLNSLLNRIIGNMEGGALACPPEQLEIA